MTAINFVYLTHLIEVIGRYDVYGSRLNRWIDKDEVSIYRWIEGISIDIDEQSRWIDVASVCFVDKHRWIDGISTNR